MMTYVSNGYHLHKEISQCHTVDGRNPAPVDKLIGGFSHYLQGFKNIPGGWPWDF